jgi:hypothetical protein
VRRALGAAPARPGAGRPRGGLPLIDVWESDVGPGDPGATAWSIFSSTWDGLSWPPRMRAGCEILVTAAGRAILVSCR